MAGRTEAYVDTSAFIAFLDRSESHHSLFARLFSDPPRLLTSPLVVAEGHGWFLRRYDSRRAFQFLAFLDDLKPLEIVTVGAADLKQASKYLRRFSDQELTIADAVGLFLMDRRRLRSCWSTDRHMGLTGGPLVFH